MKWLRNLSLKIKLIFLLVFLTGSMLLVYGGLALRDFEKDKIAYVLDSSLAHSRSTALQIRAEMSYVIEKVKFLMRGYNNIENSFHPYSKSVFSQEPNLHSCLSFSLDQATKEYKLVAELKSSDASEEEILEIKEIALKLTPYILENEISIYKLAGNTRWLLGLRFDRTGASPLVVVSTLESSHFINLFQIAQMQDTFLVNKDGMTLIAPTHKTYNMADDELNSAWSKAIGTITSTEGIYQHKNSQGENDIWLVAISDVGFGQLKIMSVIPKNAALEAVKLIMIKSVMFLGLLFCVTIFLSVLSSSSLTASLKKLLFATREIASGNFTVKVDIDGEDEIGSLSSGFNKMAGEIHRLMQETAEKARMEGELNTARLVQSTLFPKESLVDKDIEIRGFYQPASECSGDWWHHQRIGTKTIFCIGDATGHGVPAALLTAAARSAASAIETFTELPISEMMNIFNKSIYHTANGQVMMTLFLGSYDHTTGVVTYSNASHEPPYLLPNKENIKKKDIQLLNEASGPRLGESPETHYTEAQVQIAPGDRIMLYTDGVTELKNENDDMWGERTLIKLLLSESNEHMNLSHTMERISTEIANFRKDHPLQDDVTYFMFEKTKAA